MFYMLHTYTYYIYIYSTCCKYTTPKAVIVYIRLSDNTCYDTYTNTYVV